MPIQVTDKNYENHVKNNILLDFTAKFCGPCKRMKPHLEAAENCLPELNIQLPFGIVNIEENDKVSEKYKITCMPTLIFIKNGEIVHRNEGFINEKDILKLIIKNYTPLPLDKFKDE